MLDIDPNVIDDEAPYGRNVHGDPMTIPPRPFELYRLGERVFYVSFDDDNPTFVRWAYWMSKNYQRDIEFRLEDACWPTTPPGVRLVFSDVEGADRMVAEWRDRTQFAVRPGDEPYFVADPDTRLPPW